MRLPRAFSNTGLILIGSGFNKVSSIVLLMFLSRYLGVEDFGKFSFAFLYIQIFTYIAEFGLTPVLIKYISQEIVRSDEVQGKGIMLGLMTTALAFSLSWMGTYILDYQKDIRYLILMASLGLFISFRDVTFRWILEAPFRARLKMVYPVVLGICSELLGLFMVFLSVLWRGSVESILTVYVLSNLPGFILLLAISVKEVMPSFRTHSISTEEIIKEAAPIGISNILMGTYLMFGSLLLFQFKGQTDIGYYALAFRLTTSLRIIPEAIMHSLFPIMSKAYIEEPLRVEGILNTAIRYNALIAFPLAFGTMVVAPSVAVLMGGESFLPAATALSILIWATFFAFFNSILRFTFNAISMQRYNLTVSIFMTVFSILSAFILIPKFGFVGASYSLLLSEGVGFIFGLSVIRFAKLAFSFENFLRCLFASLLMSVIIWFIPSLLLQVLFGLLIYITICISIGGVNRDELSMLFPIKI